MVADRIVWRRSLCQKDALSGITALTEEWKQHVLHFIWEVVSESVYVCNCWAWRQQETKEMPPTLWMWFSCVVEKSSYCVVVNIMEVDSDWMTTWYGNMGLVEIALPCGNVIRLHVMDTMSQHDVYCCISIFSGSFQSVFFIFILWKTFVFFIWSKFRGFQPFFLVPSWSEVLFLFKDLVWQSN